MEFYIRDCLKDDLVEVTEIEELSFDDPYPYSLFAAFLAELPAGFRVGVNSEGDLIGYCILWHPNKRSESMVIASIAVHPGHRHEGLGSKLLEDAIEIAKRLSFPPTKVSKVVLQVGAENYPARHLYEKRGFRQTNVLPDYYGRGKDGIQMELKFPLT